MIPLDERDNLRRDRPIYAYFMWFYLIIVSYKKYVTSKGYAFWVSYMVLLNSMGEYSEWTLLGHQIEGGVAGLINNMSAVDNFLPKRRFMESPINLPNALIPLDKMASVYFFKVTTFFFYLKFLRISFTFESPNNRFGYKLRFEFRRW